MNDRWRRGWRITAWLLIAVQASAVLLFVLFLLSDFIPALLPEPSGTRALQWSIYGAYLAPATGAVCWWTFRDAAGPHTSPWPKRLAIVISVTAALMLSLMMLVAISIAINGYRE